MTTRSSRDEDRLAGVGTLDLSGSGFERGTALYIARRIGDPRLVRWVGAAPSVDRAGKLVSGRRGPGGALR